ncbi:putative polyprotein [Danaus plexippus plexippus]|uniref:Polyprotein n=1 Tax=Danaus plexippus plexippus TaxID=278856 RepID=A0A212EQ25_DANPL|nr:uncharacterized protein LOC116767796 [Danaus plexippus plexippus]OWR43564.1 putative polyprotein [Danaus plexippus plexippus]
MNVRGACEVGNAVRGILTASVLRGASLRGPNPSRNTQHAEIVQQLLRSYVEQTIAPEKDPIVLSPGQVQRMIRRTKLRKAPVLTESLTKFSVTFLRVAQQRRRAYIIESSGPATSLSNGGSAESSCCRSLGRTSCCQGAVAPSRCSQPSRRFSRNFCCCTSHHPSHHAMNSLPSELSTQPRSTALARVLHVLSVALDKNESAVAVTLDMGKAFDRVWHPGLLYKLATFTTPRRIVRIMATFLRDRPFQVSVKPTPSTERPIRAGVPQGSCLFPICHSNYTDDIPVAERATLALYADDAAYITTSLTPAHAAMKMQRHIDQLPQWLDKWRLKVKVSKTQAISMGRRHLPQLAGWLERGSGEKSRKEERPQEDDPIGRRLDSNHRGRVLAHS